MKPKSTPVCVAKPTQTHKRTNTNWNEWFANDVIHQQFLQNFIVQPTNYIHQYNNHFFFWVGLVCMFCVLCCRRLCLNISLGFFLSSYLSFAKIIYAFVNINLPDGFLLYVGCACREYLPQISRYCTHWFGLVGRGSCCKII